MDYKNLAKVILENVGGEQNVKQVTHCATRLRFTLVDVKKVNVEVLKNTKGVMGAVSKGGQFQVIIGSDVSHVYNAINELASFDTSNMEESEEKKGPVGAALDLLAGIFTPIIPAITGAGMLKAVLALLVAFKCIDTASQAYVILNFMSDAAFYFLPFLIANSAAKKFKVNPYVAMTIAGVLLHPTFAGLKTAGDPVSFFAIPVTLVSYSSSVIPIILGIWVMSYVEPFADKISPKAVKFFTKPLITMVVTGLLTLIVLGPIGTVLGDGIAKVISWLDTYASWLVPTIIGTVSPLLVMTGTHYGLIPIGINNIAQFQFDTVVGPGMLASNIASGAASLGVSLKTKDSDLKQLASSAGITGVCGITEPAMYGVHLKTKTSLIATMIGGGIGGLYLGIMSVGRYTSGSPGLLALPGYIGNQGFSNITHAVIGAAIGFVLAFIISFVLYKDKEVNTSTEKKNKASNNENLAITEQVDNCAYNSATGETLYSPMEGTTLSLSQVPDPTFADEILGKGIAILPSGNRAVSPVNGTITTVFNTKHAIGIQADNGAELLLHIGIDTVQLDGKYFEVSVKEGDKVTTGQELVTFDKEAIMKAGYSMITPMVVTNSSDYAEILALVGKEVKEADQVVKIVK